MAPLHRAVSFKQINVVAMGIAKYLNLDMARPLHVLFDQHGIVAKAVHGFTLAGGQRGIEVFCFVHRTHALAAAASTGLDEYRIAHAVGLALEQLGRLVAAVVAGHQRHPGFFHQLLGFGLQAHGLDGRRRRADKDQSGAAAGLGKLFVFT